jgi:hypothetical protein
MQTAYMRKYTVIEGRYVAIEMLFIDEFEKGNRTLWRYPAFRLTGWRIISSPSPIWKISASDGNIMKQVFCLFIILLASALNAGDAFTVNEEEYFSSPDTVVNSDTVNDLSLEWEKKSLGVSGEVLSVFPYTFSRDSVFHQDNSENTFNPYIFGNAKIDARLKSNYRGFANTDVDYDPEMDRTSFYLRELFVDFNMGKFVYFRAGKQVAQWGRCWLWNPTDLINVEKPVFTQRIYSREGTYGLKMSIPFGTAVNLYGFADMYKMEKAGDMGGALKLEYLLGNTEMSLSCWGKKGYNPVGGYDFSTRILGWDILGEATLSHGSNMDRVRVVNGELETYRENGQWIAKACLDLGREFDGSDIPDRYSVKFEFFYNGAGYSHNVLSDTDRYIYNMQDPSNPAATIPFRQPEPSTCSTRTFTR